MKKLGKEYEILKRHYAGEVLKQQNKKNKASLKRLGTDYIDLYYQHHLGTECANRRSGRTDVRADSRKITHWGMSEVFGGTGKKL